MRTFVLILLPAAALVVWAIVEERKLRAMDSGAGKAMQQVGVRLAACLDAVAALLDLTWDYTARQAPQAETVRRSDAAYIRAMAAIDCGRQMLRSSHQQYNDAAERFNAALRRMPARLIAGLMGFRPRTLLPDDRP